MLPVKAGTKKSGLSDERSQQNLCEIRHDGRGNVTGDFFSDPLQNSQREESEGKLQRKLESVVNSGEDGNFWASESYGIIRRA